MNFERKRFFLIVVLLAGLVLAITGCQVFSPPAYEYKGSALEPPLPLPDFELKAMDGHTFYLSDLKGDIALIYFGYTSCPDVCPLTMAEVRTALSHLKTGRERVHVLFISVDPERDTPEVLSRYMAAFGPEFIGLTDDLSKVQAMMKPYGAFAQKEEATDSAAGYLVSHTARLYLVTPQRELLLTYSFGFKPEELQSDLEYLLQQKEL